MVLDYLLQFYWPEGQRRSRKKSTRRGIRRAFFCAPRWQRDVVINIVVLLGACLVLAYSANALGLEAKLSDQRNLIFDRLGSSDGLSQVAVSTIVQDHQGFIWVGTQEGLYRYDGYSFEVFYHIEDDPGSLSHDTIWDIHPDSSGSLWVGTDAGLNRFDPATGQFETFMLNSESARGGRHNIIHAVFEDRSGTLWIGTGVGLARLNPDETIAHFHHDVRDPGSIGRGSVRAIYEDSLGNFWVGTELGGLSLMDRESGKFTRYTRQDSGLSDNYVRSIVEHNDQIWISTFNGGISILDRETGEIETIHALTDSIAGLASNRVRALLEDQRGDLWVGTDGGLHLWHPELGSFTRYTHDPTDIHSISDNTVFDLFQDAGGVIWVGTFNGISKWNANIETFPHYKRGAREGYGLSSNAITSFAEIAGDVWVGTFNGLNRWDKETRTFDLVLTRENGLADNMIMSLHADGDELWVGTMSGGVTIVKGDEVIANFEHDPADNETISSNAVPAILKDSKDRIWLTTYGGGVNRYLGNGKFARYPEAGNPRSKFSDLRAIDIEEAPDGRLWVATDGGGVVILDADTGDTESLRYEPDNPAGLSSDNVISMRYEGGTMWIGTRDSGLNRYLPETRSFVRYTKGDGLASDAVYGMLADSNGDLWISGGKGLSVLKLETGEFMTYDATHGLQSDDFNSGAYLRLSDGSFLFGGNNGFNAFDPAHIRGNTYVPPIVVTEFSKFNEPYALPSPIYRSNKVELNYDDFVIGFEFAAMDFTAPKKNRYQYRLEGFDRDWVDAKSGAHQVTYTNLDSGEYTFKVRGSNNDGVWNEVGAEVEVIVNPPIWATWWAYLLYLVLGLAVLYQIQKANELRLRREAEKRYSERLQLYIESLEEATDCVLIADANKNLMYTNNAIKSILDLSPAEAVGRSILSLLFSNTSDANLARQGLQSEGRWHGEVTSRRGIASVTTEITIAAVRDDSDNETAYVSIARDITDRKRTQAELENHRRNLEFLVAERTKALEREIAENKAFQRELANSLREKELLLKEVHHRVKNNMQVISSLLNIQAETIENPQFANLLGESQQRIKSMSLIHENLYQSDNLLEIDFEDYINMLANSLCRFYTIPGVSIGLDIQVEDVNLDIETAVPCGLIINELISNSLKHAFVGKEGRGTISVSFRNIGCRYVLQISDNGIGLPEDFEPNASSSMGMEIVSILTQQLDGRLHIDGRCGASFEISFPRKEKASV